MIWCINSYLAAQIRLGAVGPGDSCHSDAPARKLRTWGEWGGPDPLESSVRMSCAQGLPLLGHQFSVATSLSCRAAGWYVTTMF